MTAFGRVRSVAKLVLCTALLSASGAAFADAGENSGQMYSLDSFSVAAVYVDQGSNRNSGSGELLWNPQYNFTNMFSLVGNFGATVVKGASANSVNTLFTVWITEIYARYNFYPQWDAQIGGGGQDWINQGFYKGSAGASVGYHLAGVSHLDRIFVGYTRCFQTTAANEITAGIGFNF